MMIHHYRRQEELKVRKSQNTHGLLIRWTHWKPCSCLYQMSLSNPFLVTFFRNWRRQTTIATWTQSGQTDRPSKNSSKASPTSNGDRDKDHYHSDSHPGPAALTWSFTARHAMTKMPFQILKWVYVCVLFEVFQRILHTADVFLCLGVDVFLNWNVVWTYCMTEQVMMSHGGWRHDEPNLFELKSDPCIPLLIVLTLL